MFSARKTILVVDDNSINLQVLSELLGTHNYQVAIATSGEQALENVNCLSPDLILLDVMMSGIDGFETCEQLKTNPQTKNIPVLLITALSDTANKVKGLSLGAADYITKPFNHDEILARVGLHLSLREAQARLLQEEKMVALGKMVAGVAHEINNPISFIHSNLNPTQEYMQSLLKLVELYQTQASPAEIEDYTEEIDLDFIKEDCPQLLSSMRTGTERVRKIVQSLRTFSRLDEAEYKAVDLHESIDSTLVVLENRLKAKAERPQIELNKDYESSVPPLLCHSSNLNQVFFNVLTNAIDAIEESFAVSQSSFSLNRPPQLAITTALEREQIIVRIEDNGVGIAKDVQPRIFDQFFTTKPVGKGIGLGLSVSHEIITQQHQGQLLFQSQLGKGTEFTIVLPYQN